MPAKILIYGGSGGIGTATAKALAKRGYGLHLAGRHADKLKSIAEETGATYSVGDVEDDSSFEKITAEAGPSLAGLVYAVGTINLKPIARFSVEDFEHDFRLNAIGAALAIQSAISALKTYSETASIVLFSTVAVAQGFTSHASISMSKGAVEGLTRALAAELSPKIRVNAVAPSLTNTPLATGITGSSQMANAIAQMHAIPRLGEPEDIAGLVAFLVSAEADWITGQVFGVDGGRSTVRTKG